MSVVEFIQPQVLFAPSLDPEIDRLLQTAVAARAVDRERAAALLWEAQRKAPDCLPAYFALYKFYSNAKCLPEAERVARLALEEAARQSGFPPDWTRLHPATAVAVLYASEAGLFYLFTLKALAFITLRQGLEAEARALLEHLRRLDPEDRSGASVIRALAEGIDGETEQDGVPAC
jgi:hypothetical protein